MCVFCKLSLGNLLHHHSKRLAAMRVTYSGGLRDDETGHHAFIFMKRKGGQ